MVDLGGAKKASQAPAFDAVVGQQGLKDGLLAVAADPGLDGLLVRGEKGTAKSTTVRALVDCLPCQRVIESCPYGCPPGDPARQCRDCQERESPPVTKRQVPLVTLPLGATRDHVVGTLSVSDALEGNHEFDPGLLARANRGILYVDEVNLLEDHLVDILLDAAASGTNRVERDGVRVTHPASFTLVGTMNPEEGDLRPQLRDRFALQTEVTACDELEDRVAIIDQAIGEEPASAAPDDSGGEPRAGDRTAADRLQAARKRLSEVTLAESLRVQIAELCREGDLDGHRGDIATARAARVFAALDGRTTVLEPDVERAAEYALPHRLQRAPLAESGDLDELLDEQFGDQGAGDGEKGSEDGPGATDGDETAGSDQDGDDPTSDPDEAVSAESPPDGESSRSDSGSGPDASEPSDTPTAGAGDTGGDTHPDGPASGQHAPRQPGDTAAPTDGDGADSEPPDAEAPPAAREDGDDGDPPSTPVIPGQSRARAGKSTAPEIDLSAVEAPEGRAAGRAEAEHAPRGATVRTTAATHGDDVDPAASVRAAAKQGRTQVASGDLRQSVRSGDVGTLVVFAIDASASMRPAMRAAKGTVLELLEDAYQHRDEVAVVTFAGEDAEVVLPPTDSISLAARHLKALPTGDRTPLPAGLGTAREVVETADPAAAVAVVVTDGRPNAGAERPVQATRTAARELGEAVDAGLVVDCGGADAVGLTDVVAEETGASVVPIEGLCAERIDAAAQR
jgi:magnesium chelatase subunit D